MLEPQLRPKSQNELDAQVLAYVNDVYTENIGDIQPHQMKVAKLLGPMALETAKEFGVKEISPEGYVGYLKNVGGLRSPEVKGIKGFLDAYDKHKPYVKAVLAKARPLIKGQPNGNVGNPDYLGFGMSGIGFTYSIDGKDYVCRMSHGPYDSGSLLYARVLGLINASGLKNVEKLVAVSFEEGDIITEKIPGKPIDALDLADARRMRPEHIKGLVDTMVSMAKKGLEYDWDPGNFLFDPKQGFGVIDFTATKPFELTPVEALRDLSQTFWLTSNDLLMYGDLTAKEKQDVYKTRAQAFKVFVATAKEMLGEEEFGQMPKDEVFSLILSKSEDTNATGGLRSRFRIRRN